jgi:hypothetical protein
MLLILAQTARLLGFVEFCEALAILSVIPLLRPGKEVLFSPRMTFQPIRASSQQYQVGVFFDCDRDRSGR